MPVLSEAACAELRTWYEQERDSDLGCADEVLRDLLDTIAALRSQNAKLRESLSWALEDIGVFNCYGALQCWECDAPGKDSEDSIRHTPDCRYVAALSTLEEKGI